MEVGSAAMMGMGGAKTGFAQSREGKEKGSFLQKRTKKLLIVGR